MYWFHFPDLTGVIPVMRVVHQIDMGDIETVSFKTVWKASSLTNN